MVKTDIAQRIATLSSEKRDLLLQHLGQKGTQPTTQRERLEVRRTEEAPIPLSFAQQRLWFLEQMQPGESTYHMPVAFWLEGPLDLPALQRSFQQLQERHEILRTSLPLYQGSPIQDIRPSCSVTLDLTDLSHLPVAQREATARQSAQQQALLPFDLQAGPLWRASLCRLEPERHFLLVCLHHSICDGWSLNLFFEELTNLYQTNHLGTPSPLAPLTSQYADYAIWQRQCLQGERLQTLLDFWQKQVVGVPALLEFPSDYPRPTQFTQLRGATHSFWISAVLLHQLQQLAKQAQVTLYMLLLATFEILLARWSGQQDLLIGTALSQRPHPAFERVLGLFVNTLPIRSDLAGNPSF